LEHLLLDESALMESRAAPLRAYLASTVVQALTEGMLEVCRVAPSDPVDYLAEFLFKYAEHAKTQVLVFRFFQFFQSLI
jgi:adenylate kinase